MTTFTDKLFEFGGAPVGSLFMGQAWYVDPVNGADGNSGRGPGRAFKTLYQAYAKMTAGRNEVCYLMSNGAATGGAQMSKANAQAVLSSATTGKLTWAKNACHIVGLAPNAAYPRPKIAPASGTHTQATFGSGDLIEVSASGCTFANLDVLHQFSTGGVNQIAWTDSGSRNTYENVRFAGKADAASAADAGGYSLKITGVGGEHTFRRCHIGYTQLARVTASAELVFLAASPRNYFEECVILTNAGAAGCFWVALGAGAIDEYVLFRNSNFFNPTLGTPTLAATAMTVGMSINAAPGGVVLLDRCLSQGATKYTASSLAFTNLAAGAAGGGLGVAIA